MFKKLRQQFLVQHEMKNYFRYAIGEIVLVIIGILIALAISDWNQDRIAKNDTLEIVRQIDRDLSLDIDWYENTNERFQADVDVLARVAAGNYSDDDLANLLLPLTANGDPRNFNRSYDYLLASGNMKYLDDDGLLERLKNYYLIGTVKLNSMIGYHRELNISANEGVLIGKLAIVNGEHLDPAATRSQLSEGNLLAFVQTQLVYLTEILVDVESSRNEAVELKRYLIDTGYVKPG